MALENYRDVIQSSADIQAAVNAAQIIEARNLRNWQVEQNAKAMEFNAEQAELNREWQERMSNTAHQREVADLLKAGLNPVLSVTGGNGAATTSGSQAQGVTSSGAMGQLNNSLSGGLLSLLGTVIQSNNALVGAIHSADSNLTGVKYTADSASARQEDEQLHDLYVKENFPTTTMGLISALLHKSGSYQKLGSFIDKVVSDDLPQIWNKFADLLGVKVEGDRLSIPGSYTGKGGFLGSEVAKSYDMTYPIFKDVMTGFYNKVNSLDGPLSERSLETVLEDSFADAGFNLTKLPDSARDLLYYSLVGSLFAEINYGSVIDE